MDQVDNKTRILGMVPVVFAIVLLGLAHNIEFGDGFSPAELQVLDFKYRQMSIQEKQIAVPVKILEGPLYPDPLKKGNKMSGRPDAAVTTDDLEVSLIIISGDSKMAMIQGVLVKEGDIIYDKKVVKIEPDRVLLKNKENELIYLKK